MTRALQNPNQCRHIQLFNAAIFNYPSLPRNPDLKSRPPLRRTHLPKRVLPPGSPAGSNGPTSLGSSYARAITLRTEVACHCPPRGALIPRAFRASAIWPTRSRRAKPAKKGITRSGAGGLVTLFWRSVALASTAAASTRGEWRLWVMRASSGATTSARPGAAAGSPTARKGGPTPGSPAGSNGPTSCADQLIVLTLLPLRVQIRTRVSSGPDILLRTVPSRPARRGIVHDVRSSRV